MPVRLAACVKEIVEDPGVDPQHPEDQEGYEMQKDTVTKNRFLSANIPMNKKPTHKGHGGKLKNISRPISLTSPNCLFICIFAFGIKNSIVFVFSASLAPLTGSEPHFYFN